MLAVIATVEHDRHFAVRQKKASRCPRPVWLLLSKDALRNIGDCLLSSVPHLLWIEGSNEINGDSRRGNFQGILGKIERNNRKTDAYVCQVSPSSFDR